MMDPITTERMTELTMEALERIAFIIVDPIDEETHEEAVVQSPLSRFSTISFDGPVNGQLILATSDLFVQNMISSMIGEESGEINAAVEGQDALNELANILAGSVLLELGGKTHPFNLQVPQSASSQHFAEMTSASTVCRLLGDDEPLSILCNVTENVASDAA